MLLILSFLLLSPLPMSFFSVFFVPPIPLFFHVFLLFFRFLRPLQPNSSSAVFFSVQPCRSSYPLSSRRRNARGTLSTWRNTRESMSTWRQRLGIVRPVALAARRGDAKI
ncbi:hypothetical protein QBC37DRAFT_135693 [Rhypophila decipiens]|uniref:Uncharacterized protein n=1 Tax=Rhypophila decipiens TaxID=261697 RepID=A0AAN6YIQ1_9PEZI|nr:hypothetical protein QBC37DRAFT_135693 [Rhypophila decipiens]